MTTAGVGVRKRGSGVERRRRLPLAGLFAPVPVARIPAALVLGAGILVPAILAVPGARALPLTGEEADALAAEIAEVDLPEIEGFAQDADDVLAPARAGPGGLSALEADGEAVEDGEALDPPLAGNLDTFGAFSPGLPGAETVSPLAPVDPRARGALVRAAGTARPRTVRDVLRSYVNVRRRPGVRAPARPGGAPAMRGLDFGATVGAGGLGFGLGLADAVLDLPATSLLGQLIVTALKASAGPDGAVRFSVFGMGQFTVEADPSAGGISVIDSRTGRTLFQYAHASDTHGSAAPSRRPAVEMKISLTEFIWSMVKQILRTPVFYLLLLLGLIGILLSRARHA